MTGSAGAAAMFLTTLSFLVTTPGMWVRVEWIVGPFGGASAFIVKDVVLLGAAILTFAESLSAAPPRAPVS